ncbi:Uncharacterized protein FWK35_00015281 [Aphis craccivora]|uniref:Uncharacterized protein n=1 Tax=Aphis craccivora TaxID=307492 RepID=A0A6G0YCL1_APHCR|nr:Uncharacterized protein FWK35_00015281 [Aphis craccivora]
MAKCIYCLKILLLRTELTITRTEETAIVRIGAFIVKNYIKYWFTVTNVSEAPFNDINLIHTLNEYKSDDKKIADINKNINCVYVNITTSFMIDIWNMLYISSFP